MNSYVFCVYFGLMAITVGLVLGLEDPIAFTAIKGGRNEAYISFQALVVNNRADFNPLYGVFKCTSPGLYFFSFSAMSQEGKDVRISLRTNRIPVITIYNGASNSFNSATGSGLLSLTQEDIVYLFIEKGDIYESNQVNRAFTTFSGFQLSEKKAEGYLSSLLGRNAGLGIISHVNGSSPHPKVVAQQDEKDTIYTLLKAQETKQKINSPKTLNN